MSPELIALLLRFLPLLTSAGGEIFLLIQKITEALKQHAELTAEQSAALDAHIVTLEAQRWWTPDPEK
jgi:hypothetical protein